MKTFPPLAFAVVALTFAATAQTPPPFQPKPIPRLLAIPEPYDQVSIQRDRQEIARYHYGTNLHRPFVFPLIGPSGISLSRLGHPRDPQTHSHHNSFWVAHHDVNGTTFWGDAGKNAGRIVHQRMEPLLDDAGEVASVIANNAWINESNVVVMFERRQTAIQLLPDNEYFVLLDLEFAPPKGAKAVTFGKTSFGLAAVRMAKSIGVHDGGGVMRNSAGGVNEKEIFWKPAKWCDYSGVIVSNVVEGITLMDHPLNPNHPTVWHVRDDGWMGTALTFDAPRVIEPGQTLHVRYGLYVHRGMPAVNKLEERWRQFTELKLPEPVKKK
ncbi:MAG: PmoA family protein [Verrucomicrobia bacterium]|nr:PmoA family protein [Verrucomicrobiota bacterium]